MNVFNVFLLTAILTDVCQADEDEKVLSIELKDVAPGLQNTEFAYNIIKLEEDFVYIKKIVFHADTSKVHHGTLIGCSQSKTGLVMFVFFVIFIKKKE